MKKLLYLLMVLAVLASVLPYSLNVGNVNLGAGVAEASTVETFTTAGTFYWICPAYVLFAVLAIILTEGGVVICLEV